MAKNIQWKKSTLDYDKLNKLTPSKIAGSANAKNVNREKLAKILSESYKHNPKLQATLKQNASDTHNKLRESGYYKSEKHIQTMKANGNKHVESGHLANIRKDAIKASIASRKNKALQRKLDMLKHIPNKGVTKKEIEDICIENGEIKRFANTLVDPKFCLLIQVSGSKTKKDPAIYKKVETNKNL